MAWPRSMSVSKKSFPVIRFHGNGVGKEEQVKEAPSLGATGVLSTCESLSAWDNVA